MPDKKAMVAQPCAALITTDELWCVFMKLRLDKVMMVELGACGADAALGSGGDIEDIPAPEFPGLGSPYTPYQPGWWRVFVPEQAQAAGVRSA